MSCEERGHGAKLRVRGSEQQGPTTDQVSGGRDTKRGKGGMCPCWWPLGGQPRSLKLLETSGSTKVSARHRTG